MPRAAAGSTKSRRTDAAKNKRVDAFYVEPPFSLSIYLSIDNARATNRAAGRNIIAKTARARCGRRRISRDGRIAAVLRGDVARDRPDLSRAYRARQIVVF